MSCYRHQLLLLVRTDDSYADHWIWSHKGVTQGDPLESFEDITKMFNLLMTTGPARGYFPKLTKSTFIVKPAMVELAKARFNHLGFEVVTDTRYLGGCYC